MVASKGIGRGGKRLPRRKLLYFEEDYLLAKWEPFCRRLASRALMGQGGCWVGFDDALQEARMLLLDSAALYRPELGFKESTYFYAHVRGKLRSWVRSQGMIRIPGYLQEQSGEGWAGRQRCIKKYAGAAALASRIIQPQVLADDDDWSSASWAGSVEECFGDGELVVPSLAVRLAVDRLPYRLALVIKMRFGMGAWANTEPSSGSKFHKHKWHKSLNFVGKHLGLTRERVRQLQCEALDKLREMLGEEVLA